MTDERETILHLRDLHGVYERALQLAGEALFEAHATSRASALTPAEWFATLFRKAAADLTQAGALTGRWALFADDELLSLRDGESLFAGASPMLQELAQEIENRGLPASELTGTVVPDDHERASRSSEA